MSGYRSLHREQVVPGGEDDSEGGAVWSVAASPLLAQQHQQQQNSAKSSKFRIWVAGSADSCVRSYLVEESSLDQKSAELDASAAKLTLTHVLTDGGKAATTTVPSYSSSSLGCSRVCVARNYVGQDASAGNLVVVSLDLAGKMRVWEFEAASLDPAAEGGVSLQQQQQQSKQVKARHECVIEDATGTSLAMSARPASEVPLTAAVGCLDGTVALVATGLVTPKFSGKTIPQVGTVLDSWGSRGSAIALSLCWKPETTVDASSLAIGRQDGVVDIVGTCKPHHRLTKHNTPVRALSYTPDGHLLITASDQGLLCVWDTSRGPKQIALVHHLTCFKSWILSITTLTDSRRFVTASQDGKLQVWDMEHPNQVAHTFIADRPVYCTACVVPDDRSSGTNSSGKRGRLVSGNDAGWVQLYSIE